MLLMMDLVCNTGIGQLYFVTVEVDFQVQGAGAKLGEIPAKLSVIPGISLCQQVCLAQLTCLDEA